MDNINNFRITDEERNRLGLGITLTKSQLETLRQEYSKVETMPVDVLPKFHKLFNVVTDKGIRQIKEARIKFVSGLALNELIRRGLV